MYQILERQGSAIYRNSYRRTECFDIKSQRIRVLKNNPGDPLSLPNDIVNDMQFYKDRLIVLTQAGVYGMDLKNETFSSLSTDEQVNQAVERKFIMKLF